MQFDTPVYIVFLALVVAVFWRLKHRPQNVFLLAASYFFYGWWDWRFLGLILSSTVVDFFCARLISASSSTGARRLYLAFSVLVNLLFLGFFKYFNFFADSLVALLESLGVSNVPAPAFRVLLPPAISFYTFQELAYIVDVYRKRIPPASSIVDYALFVSLFPHLIAGPIQQPSHLLPQVQHERRLDWNRFFDGMLLIISGLFRKCVIADSCASIANAAFSGRLGEPSSVSVALGAYAFAWQVYGDFSGYSNIARGSAQLLGFHFMVNFRQPYLAWSLQEFWRRWHVSLSTWLRDYLFFPFCFWFTRKVENAKSTFFKKDLSVYVVGTLVTMLLGGLWHGANWTFVIWGAYFGVGLGVERIAWSLSGTRRNPLRATRWPLLSPSGVGLRLLVFHFVCVSWVLFRATSLDQAFGLFAGMGRWTWQPAYGPAAIFLALFASSLLAIDLVNERRGEEYLFEKASVPLRVAVGIVFVALIAAFSGNEANAFVYFQF
jgi:alginate O-acetyltransferase complex protein AlgI